MMHQFHDHLIRDSSRARARDAVLELGSVPLPPAQFTRRWRANAFGVLTARFDRFIAEGGKGPYPDME